MRRERFWKPTLPHDADGRWVYVLILQETADQAAFEVQAVRYFFGFDGLGLETEELSRDRFSDLDAAERAYLIKKEQLAGNGYTQSETQD